VSLLIFGFSIYSSDESTTASRHARPAPNDPTHDAMHPWHDACFVRLAEEPDAKSWPPPARGAPFVVALDTPLAG
jgi:hypothetical protein